MAKLGKLTKLRSAIKRWPSFTKITRTTSGGDLHVSITAADNKVSIDNNDNNNLRTVYVGKSRRRYLVRSETIDHPLLQELVDKSISPNNCDDNEGIVVACEVVLFEHLLWMLENSESQLGSLDELVDFYTC